MTRQEKLLKFMQHPGYKPLKFEELAAVLDVPKTDLHLLASLLEELQGQGLIIKNKKSRYSTAASAGLIIGRFCAGKRKGGFVVPDNESEDLFIGGERAGGAMHGDTVLIRILKKASDGKRREAEVVSVIQRAHEMLTGSFAKGKDGRFLLIPDDPKLTEPLFLSKEGCGALGEGDKIQAKIIRYPKGNSPAKACFSEFIGAAGDAKADITSIIRRFGIPEEFPQAAVEQAEATDTEVLPREIEGRRDFRGDLVITIDGEDAKDLDDAVCVTRRAGGGYRLCVHIADVTHYVRENTAIDLEAYQRATSVYFPDRVVPMLPKQLSNGICSLNPRVDRLTLSVVLDLDASGTVTDYEICEGVIRSVERMTYTDVTALLEGDDDKLRARYAPILSELCDMRELAELLRARRAERGAIDFNFPEPKIVLDEEGHVIDVVKYPTGISNQIVEEFMLICNETVARHACAQRLPFVYRVHETPNEEKVGNLARFLHNMDIPFQTTQEIQPQQIQAVLDTIRGTTAEKVISVVALRSMMKARYAPENLGHFGLAAQYYCHFTSPIRRYPDLTIHRILKESLKKGFSAKRRAYLDGFVARAAKQSSDMEVRSVDAERDADKLKICEYMQQFVGQEFDAVISSVTDFGIFVELDNTVEGLIGMRALDDDFYVFDKENYRITGERTGRQFTLGEPIRVQLVRSDPASRQIDFIPAELASSLRPADRKKTEGFAKKKGKKGGTGQQTRRFVKHKPRGKKK